MAPFFAAQNLQLQKANTNLVSRVTENDTKIFAVESTLRNKKLASDRLNKALTENREVFENKLQHLETELEKIKHREKESRLYQTDANPDTSCNITKPLPPPSSRTFTVFLQRFIFFQNPSQALTPFAGLNLTQCTRRRPRRPSAYSMTGR